MFRIAIAAFALTFMFSLGSYAQKTDCSTMTDDEIVRVIYEKIKVKYENHMRRVNVVSQDRVVTLQGWASTKTIRKEIEKIAKKAACVKKVKNDLSTGVPAGCPPGSKPCGDTCIPSGDKCNILSS